LISEPEWNSIREVAAKVAADVAGRRGEFFKTGIVSKRDEKNRLVWLKGYGDSPIPVVAFEYDVKYYDTDRHGKIITRVAKVLPRVPAVGQSVLVVYELGVSRLPRCVGVILGKNWITSED
jgi:hypothetical protein